MELNKATIAKLPTPAKPYSLHRDDKQRGLAVRVSALGSKTWILEKQVNGQNYRRALGAADGSAALTRSEALTQFSMVLTDLQRGEDKVTVKKAAKAVESVKATTDALTVGAALREYVEFKRRAKDKLPLKERTKADYLQMLDEPRLMKTGNMTKGGELYPVEGKPLADLTGDDIRAIYAAASKEGEPTRRQDYVMQVLRALLNWQGVTIADNPLGKGLAGKFSIKISASKPAKKPIPKAALGPFWAACGSVHSKVAGDAIRALLLSGCRPVELCGDNFGNEPLLVGAVDFKAGCFKLTNTKNRKAHTVYLSKELREILERNCKDKKSSDAVFPVQDLGKTMQAACVAAGLQRNAHTPSDTRSTFASIAAALLSSSAVTTMMNHSTSANVTENNYIAHGPEYLTECWQRVADFVVSR